MARPIASVFVDIGARTKGFVKGINKTRKEMDSFRLDLRNAKRDIAAFAAGAAAFGFVAKKTFDLGAAVEETASKFRTVFGPATQDVQGFLDEFATTAGLSNQRAQDLVATTGAIAQGMGFAQKESARFAEEITRTAADLGSFNNLETAEVLNALQSALAGEREQLKRLGIVIREADVQQRALAQSGKEAASALSQQEKAAATLTLIQERAGVAMGDLARTQDSAANTARRVRARLIDLRDHIAVEALPTMAQMVGAVDANAGAFDGLREVISTVAGWIRNFVGGIQILGAEFPVLIAKVQLWKAKLFGSTQEVISAARNYGRLKVAAEEVKMEIVAAADAANNFASAVGTSAGGATGGGGGGGGLNLSGVTAGSVIGQVAPGVSSPQGKKLERRLSLELFNVTKKATKTFMDDIKPFMVNAGASLITGLITGAGNMKDTLKNFFVSVIGFAVKFAITSAFGIASPSKVAMGWGENIVQGFQLGMERSATSLDATVRSVFQRPFDRLNPRAAAPGVSAASESRLSFNLEGIQPLTQFAIARDPAFQELFRETQLEAARAGF